MITCLTVVLAPKSEDDEDSEPAEPPFVVTKDLKLCGNFKIAGTLIVENATVLLAVRVIFQKKKKRSEVSSVTIFLFFFSEF